MLFGMNKKNKKEKMSQDSKMIRITLIMSIFTLMLSSYTFYSHIQSVKYSDSLWNASSALNERSAENRRAVARLLECQVNPQNC